MNGKVSLRKWRIEDAGEVARLANNKKIWDNLRDEFPHPYAESDAKGFISWVNGDERVYSRAITFDDILVGCISIELEEDVLRYNGVLGYWIGERYWNKGIATQAISQITDQAFYDLHIIRIYAKVFATNLGSMRALEKAGYLKEGLFKNAVFKNKSFIDQVLFAKLKT